MTLPDTAALLMQHRLMDAARLGAWFVLLLVIFAPLERLVGGRHGPRRELGADIGYFLLNGLVTKAALALPAALLVVLLRQLMPEAVLSTAAGLPFWTRAVAALMVGEVGYYWGHRWSHEIPLLWRFHAIHHSAERLDWLVNTRAHPVDIIVTRLCSFVPIQVLGLADGQGGAEAVTPLVAVLGTLWGFFVHADLPWRFGWLEAVIATPAFHHWHHTNDAHRDRNYAAMLPWLDRVFGTLHLPPRALPARYGVDHAVPHTLLGQLLHPFRPWTATGRADALAGRPPVAIGQVQGGDADQLHAGLVVQGQPGVAVEHLHRGDAYAFEAQLVDR